MQEGQTPQVGISLKKSARKHASCQDHVRHAFLRLRCETIRLNDNVAHVHKNHFDHHWSGDRMSITQNLGFNGSTNTVFIPWWRNQGDFLRDPSGPFASSQAHFYINPMAFKEQVPYKEGFYSMSERGSNNAKILGVCTSHQTTWNSRHTWDPSMLTQKSAQACMCTCKCILTWLCA